MQFDQAHDTIYVNDIHCWPFWAQTPGQGYLQWTLNNGVAINCLDVDNPMFSNIFALGYLNAINEHGGPRSNGDPYWPTRPSIRSRSRSAWPMCLAYSSIMCTSTSRRLTMPPG